MQTNHSLMRLMAVFLLLPLLAGCSGKKEKNIVLTSDADLSGLTVTCTSGNYYELKYSAREDVKVFPTKSEADAIQAVRQGLADVYVSDEVMLSREAQERLGMKMVLRGEEAFDVAFALGKGNEALMEALNAFIREAPVEEIVAHWEDGAPAVPEPDATIVPGAAPLRCITLVNMDPVCFIGDSGQWQGMDADLLRRFAASQGRPFEMVFQDMGSAVIALQTGRADIMSGCLFVTEERKASVDFTIPYTNCHPGYFVLDKEKNTRPGWGKRLEMNLLKENRWKLIVTGLGETLKITFFSILLGTLLGVGICAAKRSRRKWHRTAAGLYGNFINGIPTLVLLLIMFYVVFVDTGLSASLVAIITFALCFASSSGSIFHTAISAIPKGQTEAGLSLGLTPFKTFTGIVLPQALRKGLPLYTSDCVSLLKSTSIVGFIAVMDLTRASDLIRSRTFDAFFPLLVITLLYFLLAWIIRRVLSLFLLKKK